MTGIVTQTAVLFSVKSIIAATLALFIALNFGLSDPYWAVITTYVVAQPRAGAVLSKSVYRVLGTAVGAVMSVLVVPPLVNAPELLSIAVAVWLGICVFAAAIDRTSLSYLFVLAGYSTCIIVFPSVADPGSIFTTAVLRVQEIALGIICSSIVHATILPNSSSRLLIDRLDAALYDAKRWTAAALSESRSDTLDWDRIRLAVAVNDIYDLMTHAGYEGGQLRRQRNLYRGVLVQVERVLPLSAAVDDRIVELRRLDALAPEIVALLSDVATWVAASSDNKDHRLTALSLRQRCADLEPAATPGMTWTDALKLSLLARLTDLIVVHENCVLLRKAMSRQFTNPEDRELVRAISRTGFRSIDRDYFGAMAAGVSATLVLFVACILWIWSGWDQGANAVMLAGVFFALYSGFGNPALLLKNKLIGVAIRLVLGAVYVLVILPSIDGFPLLVASLAPVLLVSGILLTVPRYSPLAFNLVIGILGPSILSQRFEPDFAGYINNGLGTLTGVYFALLSMQFLQPFWLQGATQRLLTAGRKDLMRGRYETVERWRSRMGHRVALLTMRAVNSGSLAAESTRHALRDLTTGLSLAELAALRPRLPDDARNEVASILGCSTRYYRDLSKGNASSPPPSLLKHIDSALKSDIDGAGGVVQRDATLALVSLRRNVFPVAV